VGTQAFAVGRIAGVDRRARALESPGLGRTAVGAERIEPGHERRGGGADQVAGADERRRTAVVDADQVVALGDERQSGGGRAVVEDAGPVLSAIRVLRGRTVPPPR